MDPAPEPRRGRRLLLQAAICMPGLPESSQPALPGALQAWAARSVRSGSATTGVLFPLVLHWRLQGGAHTREAEELSRCFRSSTSAFTAATCTQRGRIAVNSGGIWGHTAPQDCRPSLGTSARHRKNINSWPNLPTPMYWHTALHQCLGGNLFYGTAQHHCVVAAPALQYDQPNAQLLGSCKRPSLWRGYPRAMQLHGWNRKAWMSESVGCILFC
jgi:hypothetical protein